MCKKLCSQNLEQEYNFWTGHDKDDYLFSYCSISWCPYANLESYEQRDDSSRIATAFSGIRSQQIPRTGANSIAKKLSVSTYMPNVKLLLF